MAEDEDLRIEALRQELMREVDAVKNEVGRDLDDIKNNITLLKWFLLALIAVFSLIAAILAFAANII